jgi:predicted AAA+ superfamily ATPase
MKIKRNIFNNLRSKITQPEILILLGAGQVGKTTLMKMLQEEVLRHKKKTRFYNLEFPQDLLFFSRTDSEIFNDLTSEKNSVIFIDEFHYLKNASKLFKAIFDLNKGIKIIASGSSSIEIHKHLKESLAGRRKLIQIYPFNLEEMKLANLDHRELLVYGGLPGLINIKDEDEKIEYLGQMVQAYLLKDVKGLIKDENIRAFNHLLYYLAEHQGSVLPVSNMASEIGMSAKSIEHYLQILEQTFVIYTLCSYSKKMSNELKKSKKYYFYDNGIRNSLIKNFKKYEKRNDQGLLFESNVYHELKNIQKANVEIRFWRTKQNDEIDFLWIENRAVVPIEVKVSTRNDRVPASIIKFKKNYPETKLCFIISLDRKEDIQLEDLKVRYIQIQDLKENIKAINDVF